MRISVSQKTVDFIINQEVVSPTYYEKKLQSPTWPGGESGVTIGIGYDLGYTTLQGVTKDWGQLVSPEALNILLKCVGLKGTTASAFMKMHPEVKTVKIPFSTARTIFINRSLVKYAKATYAIYPGLEELKPDAAGALMSMVFNRGSSLKGESRVEMLDIVKQVQERDYVDIAAAIERSKRLWVGKGLDGLIKRREFEANLVRGAGRDYKPEEIINIEV